jgi:hypothetical protein
MYPTVGNIAIIADDSQDTNQYTVTKEFEPLDITKNVQQIYFLNEPITIQVDEMNKKLEDLEHKTEACEHTQKNQFVNIKHTTQQLTTSIINDSVTVLQKSINTMVNE